MWLCKVLKLEELPKWATVTKGQIELPNARYTYWKKQGWVEGIKQFKYKRIRRYCKECGEYRWVRVKLYWLEKKNRFQDLVEVD